MTYKPAVTKPTDTMEMLKLLIPYGFTHVSRDSMWMAWQAYLILKAKDEANAQLQQQVTERDGIIKAMELAEQHDEEQIASLEAQVEKVQHDNSIWKLLVTDMSEGFECLPDCNSHGHESECPVTDPPSAFRLLRKRITELEAQLAHVMETYRPIHNVGCRKFVGDLCDCDYWERHRAHEVLLSPKDVSQPKEQEWHGVDCICEQCIQRLIP